MYVHCMYVKLCVEFFIKYMHMCEYQCNPINLAYVCCNCITIYVHAVVDNELFVKMNLHVAGAQAISYTNLRYICM